MCMKCTMPHRCWNCESEMMLTALELFGKQGAMAGTSVLVVRSTLRLAAATQHVVAEPARIQD